MRSGTRGYAGALTVLAVVLAGAGRGGEGDALGSRDDVDQVEPEALVPLLLTEDDDVDASSFGPMPMTSENPGDDYYQTPPTQLCEAGPDVALLADEDIYAYLGDGGDYLYIDHWVTGEPLAAASDRFDEALAAIEGCGDDFFAEQVDITHPGVEEVRRYETPEGEGDEYGSFVYARNGGVLMLLSVDSLNPDRYDRDDVDHLIDVALDKLASIGRVEVAD